MSPPKDPVLAYKSLDVKEKARVGEALVKVNMGLASPAEQRMVAGFLKSSVYIAKPGGLDGLIAKINEADKEHTPPDKTGTVELKMDPDDKLFSRELRHYSADFDKTRSGK